MSIILKINIIGLRINNKNQSELKIEKILSEIQDLSLNVEVKNIIEYKFDERLVPYRTLNQINDLNKICPSTLEFVYSADLTNGLANINYEFFLYQLKLLHHKTLRLNLFCERS